MATADRTSLKIGLVLDDSLDPPDGVQQYVLTLGAWLSDEGHEVHYLVGQTSQRQLPHIHSLSKTLSVRFNGNRMGTPLPASKKAIKKLFAAEQFDVLHVQTPFSPFMAGRIVGAAPKTTAVVGTFHVLPDSWLSAHANKLLGVLARRAWRRFDAVACVSQAAQDFAQDICKVPTQVIPNVVSVSRFASAQGTKSADKISILFLGRLVPRKGCQHLLEALKVLQERRQDLPPFQVRICGKGPLLETLQQYVKTNQLETVVRFEGFIEESAKPALLASSDITVLPSTGGESFGISVVEAMASGAAAVIGGDNTGYRSILGDQPELLCDPTCHEAFADKLALFLRDAALRQTMAAWGKTAAEQYDVQLVGPRIVELYQQSLQSRRNMR